MSGMVSAAGGTPVSGVPHGTLLTSAEALHCLLEHVGDHTLVARLAHAYPTWEALLAADRGDLAFRAGPWAVQLRLPKRCPGLPDLGSGVFAVGFTDGTYPHMLLDLPDAPVLLYVRGAVPPGPAIAVDGMFLGTDDGKSAARAAAALAAEAGVAVVASLDTSIGRAALDAACRAGGRAVAVASHDVAAAGTTSGLVADILANGGAVVSEQGPGVGTSDGHAYAAARLVAALGSAVMVAEASATPRGGMHLVRAAVGLNRRLVVPDEDDPYTGVGLSITSALSHASRYNPALFGTSEHIKSRLRSGLAPADAVVGDAQHLRSVIDLVRDTPPLPSPHRVTLPQLPGRH